ncbi:MAG: hypothetical protein AAGG46_01745 [Planctomycetota bacterium]
MSKEQSPLAPLFSQVDVTTGSQPQTVLQPAEEQSELLREVLSAQDRTNELLEELVATLGANQKQRQHELGQWKQANPDLAERCRGAAETLSKVQVEYLDRLTDDIEDAEEDLVDGEFMLNEFIDRYGPRLAHLNGVIQVLAQLSASPAAAEQEQEE